MYDFNFVTRFRSCNLKPLKNYFGTLSRISQRLRPPKITDDAVAVFSAYMYIVTQCFQLHVHVNANNYVKVNYYTYFSQ